MQCEDCSFNVLGRSWGFLSVVVEGAGLVYVVEFVGRGRSGVVGARCGCLGCWGCGVLPAEWRMPVLLSQSGLGVGGRLSLSVGRS